MIGLRAEERDPRETDEHGGYTLRQVLEAERWAWAGEVVGQRAEFFYDGIEFWRRGRSGGPRPAARLETPAEGWWHKPSCRCPLCREQSARLAAKPQEAPPS